MKPKTNIKKYRKDIVYTLIIVNIFIYFAAYTVSSRFYDHYVEVLTAALSEPVKEAKAEKQVEPTIREWVLAETRKAGLKESDITCLIDHESGWREMAYHVNTDKSLDRGLWMWNDKWHDNIPNECAFDAKCSTREAITKIKRDGYGAWYGWKNGCK